MKPVTRCRPFSTLLIVLLLPLAHCKWRTQPSRYTSPGTFTNVCVGRDSSDASPKIYFAAPAGPTDGSVGRLPGEPPPQSVSLGNPTPTETAPLGGGFRFQYPEASQTKATIVMTADESPHAMASQMYLTNRSSESIDVHYVGGTTVLMHTPCDILGDNYCAWRATALPPDAPAAIADTHTSARLVRGADNTMTEEGPMLARAVENAREYDRRNGRASHVSLLLENRCPHHAYRDELRDMLIGRDHAVWKVLPSTWTCSERLITPPDPPAKLERSLQAYVERLKASAQDQHDHATVLRARRNRHARLLSSAGGDDVCAEDSTDESCDGGVERQLPVSNGLDPPLRIVVVQRTMEERRILNLDKLVSELKRTLSSANFTEAADLPLPAVGSAGPRAVPFVELLVRRASVEVIYFEGMELWEQVRRVRDIDILIGATGSGLTNLAFLEPGAMIIELASAKYEQQFFDTLVMRVHGSLLRGVVTYRKSYAKSTKPIESDHRGSSGSSSGMSKGFTMHANTSDVSRLVMEELQFRARGWWSAMAENS